ncbi:sensor histidine kinase [Streptacidiphilus monticola]|uniref:histidine kinase n=1 Tax=Streptacidiphilus monticola TaxID=2161674 RepID=A0ABW1FVQ7_9ACTN
MKDLLVIAAYAALGAGAAGLVGWPLVHWARRRSLALSLFVLAAVTVLAMAAGTVSVVEAMFLSRHDFGVAITVTAMAAVVSVGLALLLGRQVVTGARALATAARTVGSETGFAAPAAPLGSAELDALSAELAATSERLAESRRREQTLERSRRELIAWISHDLRTPLAGLRAMAEALEDGVAEDPARYLTRMRTEVDRLSGMVDDLFELSRIQAGALTLSLSRVSVYDLVGDAIAGVHPLAHERRVRLVGREIAREPVLVDSREITRVLENLLVNAIRSTPEDGVVAVAAQHRDGEVLLSVSDACGGIPEADLPHVFDTGWRGSAARTPAATTGAGLGLAIVRGIVEAHQGRASVRNTPTGCCFEVTLPAALPADLPLN